MVKPNQVNGGRWRAARRRVLRTETVCAECGQPVDKTLHWLDPMAPQVDHKQAVAVGGELWARSNLQLMHRSCNRAKGIGHARPDRTPTALEW